MDNVGPFNKAEKGHTCVRLKGLKTAFTLKIPYDRFKVIYEENTSKFIKSFKDYHFEGDNEDPDYNED